MDLDIGIINLLLSDVAYILLLIKALLIPVVAFVYSFILFSLGFLVYKLIRFLIASPATKDINL